MKLEGEAVTFCSHALGLDWGMGFDRAGRQQCLMELTAERNKYSENEQECYQFGEHQPALHQLNMQGAAEMNHHHLGEHQISRFDAASRNFDQSKFLYITTDRLSGDDGGGFQHHEKNCNHRLYQQSEDHKDVHCDIASERPNIASPCCGIIDSTSAYLEDGSLRVMAEAKSLPFCEVLSEFPITNMANPSRQLVVGYALTAKKALSFLKPSLVTSARSKGIVFSVIDYDKPLVDQGPFDVILHKITGEVWHEHLKVYEKNNPTVLIFDPPEAIIKVYNRKSMLQEVADLKFQHSQGNVGVPKQLVVDVDSVSISEEVARENLRFPLVVKPLWIDGTSKSHALSLAVNECGLSSLTTPLVLQEFISHGGVMFKVYVVGHLIKVVHRPSLSNVCGDEVKATGVVAFPRVSSAAALAAESDPNLGAIEYPPEEMLSSLAKQLRSKLCLNLFNLDMIRDSGKCNQYYVIDINYFPGYGKVPDYEDLFTEFLSCLASEREHE